MAKPTTTVSRQEVLYSKILESNHVAKDLKAMNLKEYNKALGTNIKKVSSLKAQKRLITQIENNIEVIQKHYVQKRTIKNIWFVESIREMSKRSFEPPKPKKVKKPIKKVPKLKKKEPNTFIKIKNDIKDKYQVSNREAILTTRFLLKVPRKDYKDLQKGEKDILTQYGY